MLCESQKDFLEVFVMYETQMPHVNGTKNARLEGIEMCAMIGCTGIFSRASGSLKGGQVMFIERGRKSWYIDSPFRIIMPPPCLGEVGKFGFLPHMHGAAKIFFVI